MVRFALLDAAGRATCNLTSAKSTSPDSATVRSSSSGSTARWAKPSKPWGWRSNRMSWPLWLVVSLVAVLGVLRPLGRWLQRKGRDMERHD